MKITMQQGVLTAQAETIADMKALFSLGTLNGTVEREKRHYKKHKKHQFTKVCGGCSKECKGNMGMAIHIAKNRSCKNYYEGITA